MALDISHVTVGTRCMAVTGTVHWCAYVMEDVGKQEHIYILHIVAVQGEQWLLITKWY